MSPADLPERLASKIAVDLASGCWLWGGTVHHGYAYTRWQNGERTHAYAHRLTYHLLVDQTSPISGGGRRDQIDHVAERCTHRPTCVNPAHMQRVTARINSARSKMRPTTESRFVGVRRLGRVWRASIQIGGQRIELGSFTTEESAALAYDEACMVNDEQPVNLTHGLFGPVLSTEQLAERWGVKRSSIDAKRRDGRIPAPFNAGWGHSFRWHLDVIEAYEQQAVGA